MKFYISLSHIKILKALYELLTTQKSITRKDVIKKSGVSNSTFTKNTYNRYILEKNNKD